MFLDSFLLLFDGLQNVNPQYMVQEEKYFLGRNLEASRKCLYPEVACLGLYIN